MSGASVLLAKSSHLVESYGLCVQGNALSPSKGLKFSLTALM